MKRLTALMTALWLTSALTACGGGAPRTVSAPTDDATITARVKTALLNDPQVNANAINVATSNGVVQISGAVKSKDEEARVVQVARQVNGVRDVQTNLRVGG